MVAISSQIGIVAGRTRRFVAVSGGKRRLTCAPTGAESPEVAPVSAPTVAALADSIRLRCFASDTSRLYNVGNPADRDVSE
jgi:hypothetical protein